MSGETILTGARIVLPSEVVVGTLAMADGRIASVDHGRSSLPAAIDLEGDFLLPGLIDVHTDHFEKHVYPRAHVRWNIERAVMAHDAQVIGGGITTVFDSLCVGATESNPERREILVPMIEALERASAAGALRAEHLVHLRCEITDKQTPALMGHTIGRDIVRVVSVMEHLPGKRQSRDLEHYIARRMKHTGAPRAHVEAEAERLVAEKGANSEAVRAEIVAIARASGLPMFSHDDASAEHVLMAQDEGISVSEFPVTMEAAREARRHGMAIVAGAPNLLLGGSQSGNLAVSALVADDLVDVLASDYVPRAIVDAIFMLAADERVDLDLPAAARMATANAAGICGLSDRGAIAPGLRADLLRVRVLDGHPVVRTAWRAGEVVN